VWFTPHIWLLEQQWFGDPQTNTTNAEVGIQLNETHSTPPLCL
jgi:hypothetical protein